MRPRPSQDGTIGPPVSFCAFCSPCGKFRIVQVFFSREGMSKRSKRSKSGSSKRKSVKAYTSKKQRATRTAAVERNLKYAEKKNIDTPFNLTGTLSPVETALTPTACLCVCSQGAAADERLGRRIRVKSIYVRGRISVPTNMTGSGMFRMIIFQDKQPNGSVPGATDLLQANEFVSPINLGNSKRFKILADETLGGILFSLDSDEGRTFERYIKTNIEVGYTNNILTGTAADVLTNGIYAMFFLGGFGAGVGAMVGRVYFRVRFVDY